MQALLWATLLSSAGFAPAAVQQGTGDETRFHRVYLRNGNVIEGQLLKETPSQVVLQLAVGEMAIRRDQIERVELVRIRSITEATAVKRAAAFARREETVAVTAEPISKGQPPLSAVRSAGPAPALSEALLKQLEALISKWKLTVTAKVELPEEDLSAELQDLGPETIPYLAWLLGQSPARLPPGALALALGRSGRPEALAALGDLLNSKDPDLRRKAVDGLIQSAAAAEPYLLAALDDETLEVWQAASRSLGDRIRKEGGNGCFKAVVARMVQAKVKAPYALALGQAGTPEAHRELLDLFQQGDETCRLAALQGLDLIRDPQDAEVVLKHLSAGSPLIRKQICIFLGKVKARSAVNELIGLLKDSDVGLQTNAHWALQQITGQPLAPNPELWKSWWETTGSKEQQ